MPFFFSSNSSLSKNVGYECKNEVFSLAVNLKDKRIQIASRVAEMKALFPEQLTIDNDKLTLKIQQSTVTSQTQPAFQKLVGILNNELILYLSDTDILNTAFTAFCGGKGKKIQVQEPGSSTNNFAC